MPQKSPIHWIYGRGWDQMIGKTGSILDKGHPDSLFPDRPVFLKRIDGHAVIANQRALDIAGFNIQTKFQVVSGSQNGKLTGILIDNAMDELENSFPWYPILWPGSIISKPDEVFFIRTDQYMIAESPKIRFGWWMPEQRSGKLKMKIFALLSTVYPITTVG